MYDSEGPSSRSGAMDRLKRLLVLGLVLVLLAVAGYLQAERNHRTYFAGTRDGLLVISKGSFFLWGSRPYVPDDPPTAETYAPIPLPGGLPPVPDARFAEREELDRFLFGLLAGWAEPRIRSGETDRIAEGFLYVDRATRLTGLTGKQTRRLRELRAEVAFYEARDRIERAGVLLAEACEKLQLATDGSGHAREAAILLEQIEPAHRAVGHALAVVGRGGATIGGAVPAFDTAPRSGEAMAPIPAAVPEIAPIPASPALPSGPVLRPEGAGDPRLAAPVEGAPSGS